MIAWCASRVIGNTARKPRHATPKKSGVSESSALIIHSAPAGCGCLFGTYPAAASSAIGNASATIATSFGRSTASAAYLQVVGRR